MRKETKKEGSKLKIHDCENSYQDERYGYHIRVCNATQKPGIYRCTVCGKLV
jgi:hypothetical protein